MKGIILSGGHGTRLYPLTKITSKQLLPVYNKPMVFYPLQKLLDAGIKEILIIVAPDYCGEYMRVLGSGKDFGAHFTYEIQDKPEGLAQAFVMGEEFIGDDDVCMILGDNLFDADLTDAVTTFKGGGRIFALEVPDPERFGQVKFDDTGKALQIEEKANPAISKYAIPGIYIYDKRCVEAAKQAKPSARGEIEITEIHNWYLQKNELDVKILEGQWLDAGTFDTLLAAQNWAKQTAHNT